MSRRSQYRLSFILWNIISSWRCRTTSTWRRS